MLLGVIQHRDSQVALFAPPHTYEHKFCSHFQNLYRHFVFKSAHQIFLVTFWRHLITDLSYRWHQQSTLKDEPSQVPCTSAMLHKANNGNFLDHIAFSSLPSLQKSVCFPFILHCSSFVVGTVVLSASQKVTLWKAPSPLHVTLLPRCNTSYNLILSQGVVKSLLTSYCQKQHINSMFWDPTILHLISLPVGILVF